MSFANFSTMSNSFKKSEFDLSFMPSWNYIEPIQNKVQILSTNYS